MTHRFSILRFFMVALALASSQVTWAKPSAPSWVKGLKRVEVPLFALEEKPDVVILRDEMSIRVSPSGTFHTTVSMAYLLKKANGFAQASARVLYYEDTDKVLSLKAWVIPPKGKMISYGKKDIADYVYQDYKSIASSARIKSIDAKGDVVVGSIFAYEAVTENDDIFAQESWYFQGEYPSIRSSISIELPSSWDVKTHFFNMDELQPDVTGDVRTWTLTDLPGLERQPMGPQNNELLKWVAFDFIPGPKSKRKHFGSWENISLHGTPTYESQTVINDEMESKVQDLTAGRSEFIETVKPLAELAQSVNYISVSLDLGSGGGLKPRPADEVFRSNYGDCKDKTNLLQSLLKIKGIDLYPVIVHSGSSATRIFESWPSSSQFNHCISAISVDDDFESPAVVEHEKLGKLLIFDPTDTYTCFGDIPHYLQGTKGMILAGNIGGLIELPKIPSENSIIKRELQLELMPTGHAVGKLKELSTGQVARWEREVAFQNESDYSETTKDWMARFLPGTEIGEPSRNDNIDTGEFSMEVDFKTPNFAKNMRNRLLIFKPIVLNRRDSLPFGDEERTQSVFLKAYNLDETAEIFLPSGFEVSELPESVFREESFGSYRVKYSVEGDRLLVRRQYRLDPVEVPIEEFPTLEAFYKRMIKVEQTPVVLERS